MSRALRTKIPSIVGNFEPKVINKNDYKEKVKSNLRKCTEYYNKKSKVFKPVHKGDKVMFKKTPSSCWLPGKIVEVCKEPRSFVVSDENGSVFRRSQEHIKEKPENDTNNETYNNTEVTNKENCTNLYNEDGDEEAIVEKNLNFTKQNKNENYVTQKGRTVKRPEKLNL